MALSSHVLSDESPLNDMLGGICMPVIGINIFILMMSVIKSDLGADGFGFP